MDQAPESQLSAYAIDGMVPRTVLLPSSEAEVAEALRAAADEGAVVVPWGAGSYQDLGNPPERVDVVLSLERLNRVIDYIPADMTITVGAGMRLADLDALTAVNGQRLPSDPPRGAQATVGGIVATAAAGPRRMAYGGVRDLVLGVRLALVSGKVVKAGGKVVKNVAGYDLPKLVIGSLGTLAVVTEVSVRLRPVPADRRTLLLTFADVGQALSTAEAVLNSELLPAAVVVLSPEAATRLEAPGAASLAVAIEETKENNDYQADRLATMSGGADARTLVDGEESVFWDRLTNYQDCFGAEFRVKANTVISELGTQMPAEGLETIAYAGSGTVMSYGFKSGARAVEAVKQRFASASACGGSAVLESGPAALRREVDVWGPARPEWKLTRSLKKTFDPQGILNRGRYVGGI